MGFLNWLKDAVIKKSNTQITPEELWRQIRSKQSMVLVDVREREELRGPLGVLPGAKNIPLSELGKRFQEIPRDRQVVLICLSGSRSRQAQGFLAGRGYTQVKNAAGGMLAVRRATPA